jgi:hypothetical protein
MIHVISLSRGLTILFGLEWLIIESLRDITNKIRQKTTGSLIDTYTIMYVLQIAYKSSILDKTREITQGSFTICIYMK